MQQRKQNLKPPPRKKESSATRIQSLKSLLKFVKKTGSVKEYLSKIQGLVDSLFAIGYKSQEEDHIATILDDLSEEYTIFIT
ncbi:hypothetical protein AHAS_Ahas08G0174600 [Arachis hypogaea]